MIDPGLCLTKIEVRIRLCKKLFWRLYDVNNRGKILCVFLNSISTQNEGKNELIHSLANLMRFQKITRDFGLFHY